MDTNKSQRELVCESCGVTFGCYPAPEGGCWCAEVKLSDEARTEVRSKFGDCLCPDCLVKFAEIRNRETTSKA